MPLDKIKACLTKIASLPPVTLHYQDLTRGESTGNYLALAPKQLFLEIEAFTAAAIVSVARHMEGDESPLETWNGVNWEDLEADLADPPSWAAFFNPALRTGRWTDLVSKALPTLDPPNQLLRRIYVEPNFSGVEECVVCETSTHYVLCYWYTTG